VGHSEAPWASLVFSPDSRTLASGNWHGIIQLWDAETGALIGRPWTDYLGWVRDLAFTPDGRVLISSGGDRIIRLWNTKTGGIERKLLTRGEAEFVRAMALNPEGTMIASGNSYSSGGERDTVYLWETSTGEMMESMRIEYDQPWSLAFSPDGTLLAGGFPGVGGGQIVLWDLAAGEEIGSWSTGGYYAIISDLAFNSDGTELAAYQSSWYPENQRKIWVLDLETNDIARLVHR
jgi:WD40 repeat protein